ncbi:hypothetical protein IWQ62_001394 [Dispira parvispora]|uniref:Uncharacterized protein n=1 Tax=Dispira parvispora TaxID=1520584 RepID=A0A9W8AYG4_9FUNG|nr:hypothetical protein IWQ62_001394 [Dispira parvispora]
MDALASSICDDLSMHPQTPDYLLERATSSTKNMVVDDINILAIENSAASARKLQLLSADTNDATMDQQELYTFTTHVIQEYDTDRAVPEPLVTAIAQLFLDCGDKDGRHGFLRKSETIYRPNKLNVSPEEEAKIQLPYKTDFYKAPFRDGELIRVARAEDDREVLIVTCKSDHDYNGRAMDQLRAHMTISNFPVGLLLSQRRAFFFFQGKNDDEGIQPGPEFSDISKHVPEIADIIRDL